MGDWLPLGLLAGALLGFWLSTRQMALGARALIWLLGALCLGLAGASLLGAGLRVGALGSMLLTLIKGPSSLALEANWTTVAQALLAIFAVLGAVAALVGALALLAFTPGEKIEHLTRRLVVLLVGVFIGGVLALSSVALGFAGYMKPRAYIFSGDRAEILDGDTIKIGDVSLRLDEIDALESDQNCFAGSYSNCGEEARQRLLDLIAGDLVICRRRDRVAIPPRESFSRPVVACGTRDVPDLSEAMLQTGLAVRYAPRARANTIISVGERCTLHPSHWRAGGLRSSFMREQTATALCAGEG